MEACRHHFCHVWMFLFRVKGEVVLAAEMLVIWIFGTCCLETAVLWALCFLAKCTNTHSLVKLRWP